MTRRQENEKACIKFSTISALAQTTKGIGLSQSTEFNAWKERWHELIKDLRSKELSYIHRFPPVLKAETIQDLVAILTGETGLSISELEEGFKLVQSKVLMVPLAGCLAKELGFPETKIQEIACIAAVHYFDEWFSGFFHPYSLDMRSPEIPYQSKILAVAEMYEDMILGRRWPKAYMAEEAIHEMKSRKWRQLDPDLVEALVRVWDKKIRPNVPLPLNLLKADSLPFRLSGADQDLRPYYHFLYAYQKGRALFETLGPLAPVGERVLALLSKTVSDQILKTEVLEAYPFTVKYLREKHDVFTLSRWREAPKTWWQKLSAWTRTSEIPGEEWRMIETELRKLLPEAFRRENRLVLLDHALLFAFTRLAHTLDYWHSLDKEAAVERAKADWSHVPKETRASFVAYEFALLVSANGSQPGLSVEEALLNLEERSDIWLDPAMVAMFKECGEAGILPFYTELKEKDRVKKFAEDLVLKSKVLEES